MKMLLSVPVMKIMPRYEAARGGRRYGYSGQGVNLDGSVGFLARDYDPQTGRWLAQDTWTGSRMLPESLQKYQFVFNDPVTLQDEDGFYPVKPVTAVTRYKTGRGVKTRAGYKAGVGGKSRVAGFGGRVDGKQVVEALTVGNRGRVSNSVARPPVVRPVPGGVVARSGVVRRGGGVRDAKNRSGEVTQQRHQKQERKCVAAKNHYAARICGLRTWGKHQLNKPYDNFKVWAKTEEGQTVADGAAALSVVGVLTLIKNPTMRSLAPYVGAFSFVTGLVATAISCANGDDFSCMIGLFAAAIPNARRMAKISDLTSLDTNLEKISAFITAYETEKSLNRMMFRWWEELGK